MTKIELENRVEELEKELENKKDFKELKERNKELVQQVFDFNKKQNELQAQIKQQGKDHEQHLAEKQKQIDLMGEQFNALAKLFEEYIKVFDDNVSINQLFLDNIRNNQALMKSKLEKFNQGE